MAKCCGTCTYHIPMPMDEWVCDNEDSENYGCETEYKDCCADHNAKGE